MFVHMCRHQCYNWEEGGGGGRACTEAECFYVFDGFHPWTNVHAHTHIHAHECTHLCKHTKVPNVL